MSFDYYHSITVKRDIENITDLNISYQDRLREIIVASSSKYFFFTTYTRLHLHEKDHRGYHCSNYPQLTEVDM